MKPFNMRVKVAFDFLKKWIKKNVFLLVTILSVFIGILLGFLLRQFTSLSNIEKSYLGFPGEIFLRLIKLLILPLIVSSLISSIGNIAKHSIGEYLFLFFLSKLMSI